MQRSQFPGVFLVVEGATDAVFFRRFVVEAACNIVVAAQRASALRVIGSLNAAAVGGVVCVVDADFGRIEMEELPSNTFSTDCHDLEITLCRTRAFSKVHAELGSAE